MNSMKLDWMLPKYKVTKSGETRVYDYQCPKCGWMEMLSTWSSEALEYVSYRCSSISCDYVGKPKGR